MGVIFFCLATRAYLVLEDGQQGYFKRRQIGKKTYAMFNDMGYQRTTSPGLYMDKGEGAN